MDTIEFLKAKNKDYRVKFINILKDVSTLNVSQLSNFYDRLLKSEKVVVKFKITDLKSFNDLVMELMELGISIGYCSYHKEN